MDYIAYQDEAQLNHSHITITGPKAEVDQITQAVIPVNLSGRVDTIREEFDYLLCNEAGQEVAATSVTTNVEKIYYTLKIQLVKEIQLLVNVIYGGGATQDTASVVLSNQSIKISGSEKLLEGLGSITLGTVDLSTIAEDTVLSFPLTLPEGVVNISGITEVTADITFPRLKVRELYVSNITLINMPEGMQADIDTKRMKVTLRGPDVLMNAIQVDNVSIVVDMTQAELGTNLYKAQIVLDDTVYEGVGAIGSYTVTVTMTQAPPPVEETP
jgi:YbbR domain-containing protein